MQRARTGVVTSAESCLACRRVVPAPWQRRLFDDDDDDDDGPRYWQRAEAVPPFFLVIGIVGRTRTEGETSPAWPNLGCGREPVSNCWGRAHRGGGGGWLPAPARLKSPAPERRGGLAVGCLGWRDAAPLSSVRRPLRFLCRDHVHLLQQNRHSIRTICKVGDTTDGVS